MKLLIMHSSAVSSLGQNVLLSILFPVKGYIKRNDLKGFLLHLTAFLRNLSVLCELARTTGSVALLSTL